jgi:hypothetical protein
MFCAGTKTSLLLAKTKEKIVGGGEKTYLFCVAAGSGTTISAGSARLFTTRA